ncbi:class I SAM-dependent methyltransferase [Spongiactinospora sp. 9N601]|uniref:class I SAM-dependent methyltransferase n=1 Tax=Spongiactinospora sp. 9N601 TaxID=3375149 RepID=UPI0037A60E2C
MSGISTAGLSGQEETALITLHARAVDAKAAQPILGDPHAVRVAQALDYDWERLAPSPKLEQKERLNVTVRATHFDRWVRRFIAGNPDAIVLDLGCGLDSRGYRVDPPSGVDWYDVDLPKMIAIRAQVYQETANIHMLGSSLSDEGWLEALPAHRPVVAVMDGLYPWIAQSDFITLLRRITAHFDRGEILLLGFSKLSSRMMRTVVPAVKTLGVPVSQGFDDPYDVERWNPNLRFTAQERLISSPEVAKMPRGEQIRCAIMRAVPGLARLDKGMLKYTFDRS